VRGRHKNAFAAPNPAREEVDGLDEFFDISTWLTAILGSIVLLVLYRILVDRGGHGRTLRT
jgi:hypothetical protein